MLDQSFSAANFRKIVDIENRKGNYLEGEFFSDVDEKRKEIKSVKDELQSLNNERAEYGESEYEEIRYELSEQLKLLKEEKEQLLLHSLDSISKGNYSPPTRPIIHVCG